MLFLTEYKVVEGYGEIYDKKRWEVRRSYKYLNYKGEVVCDWILMFYSNSKKRCEKFLEEYKSNPQKNYNINNF